MNNGYSTNTLSRLRHRVTLQSPQLTPDGSGGYVELWSDTGTIWASIEPLSSAMRLTAEQMDYTVTHRVTLRYRAAVSVGMRLSFKSRILHIHAVINPEERNIWLQLLAEEEQ